MAAGPRTRRRQSGQTADTALLRAECALHRHRNRLSATGRSLSRRALVACHAQPAGWVAGRQPTLPPSSPTGLPASLADALELDDADPAGVGASMHPLLLLLPPPRHLGSADWQERIAEVSRLSRLESASLVACGPMSALSWSGHAACRPSRPPRHWCSLPDASSRDDPYRCTGMLRAAHRGLRRPGRDDDDPRPPGNRLPLFGLHTPPVLLGCGEDGQLRPAGCCRREAPTC